MGEHWALILIVAWAAIRMNRVMKIISHRVLLEQADSWYESKGKVGALWLASMQAFVWQFILLVWLSKLGPLEGIAELPGRRRLF